MPVRRRPAAHGACGPSAGRRAQPTGRRLLAAAAAALLSGSPAAGAAAGGAGNALAAGEYVALEWFDNKRVMMRVSKGAALPPIDEELMLEELENWKWRVETAAADAAVLVSFSYCPHGLGLLPSALSWVGSGRWRQWPGTFEYQKGQLEGAGPGSQATLSFTEAKLRCYEMEDCKGFSYDEMWSDKDRESGEPRLVRFSTSDRLAGPAGKQHSWVRRDNPRAACNPEGEAFQCPNSPYACLGLSMDADDGAIKQAYRALSRTMHPDKIPAAKRTPQAVKSAEEKFRQIADAEELLRNTQERRKKDQQLRQHRKNWERQKADEADLYIKEPKVSTLEPESYPVLIPKGQEWIVHFFLPTNDDCKQMKMAMGRVVQALGDGEEERGLPASPKKPLDASFRPGDVFRGSLRERSSGLRNVGGQSQEGDTRLTLVVGEDGAARLWVTNDPMDVRIASEGGTTKIIGAHRILTGKFDGDMLSFRGGIAASDAPDQDTASFLLVRDTWTAPQQAAAAEPGSRQRPRLFGAVNCGRFRDFCKKKGADPAITKRFPQVRVLFPDQGRFEVYHGRPLGRELAAFARESSRTPVVVPELLWENVTELSAGAKKPWLVLLKKEPTDKKKRMDCDLCKASLPMLGRAAPRLIKAGVQVAWANCTDSASSLCTSLGGAEEESTWGSLRFVEMGGGDGVGHATALWDAGLIAGEMSQSGLLAALESAGRTAEFIFGLRAAAEAAAGADAAPGSSGPTGPGRPDAIPPTRSEL